MQSLNVSDTGLESCKSCRACLACTARSLVSRRARAHPSRLILQSKRLLWYATAEDKGSVVTDEGIPRPSPLKGTKLKRVERLGAESWAGVAAVDRGETSQVGRTALLVGGDTAALLLFAAIGRRNHGEGLQVLETFNTALPFLVGWAVAAGLTGAYSSTKDRSVSKAARTASKAWILAVPASLVLRSIQRGYMPDKSFVIVSFIATGVLLIGWRSALAAATEKSGQGQERQNKRGNPLEFLQLLASLTKRW
ncbi:TPA: hypothetical protein ACH3X1_002868 [Trebouxia sp. C0004]